MPYMYLLIEYHTNCDSSERCEKNSDQIRIGLCGSLFSLNIGSIFRSAWIKTDVERSIRANLLMETHIYLLNFQHLQRMR